MPEDGSCTDVAAHEGHAAPAFKPRETSATAPIRETSLSGWNKEAAKNPFISERSLQKNEEVGANLSIAILLPNVGKKLAALQLTGDDCHPLAFADSIIRESMLLAWR